MPIPSELLDYKQLILWRRTEVNGRIAKLPISPWSGKLASCDKPQTWSTYRHACYARRKFRSDGFGFVFTSSDPFCGIDLDQCRTRDGKIAPEPQPVIDRVARGIALGCWDPYFGESKTAWARAPNRETRAL